MISSVLSTSETEPDTAVGLSVEPYLAQRGSRLFHARECRWAARIKHVDRVAFECVADAEAQGLTDARRVSLLDRRVSNSQR